MRVVLPLQDERWDELEKVAASWAEREPASPEAWYYLGLAMDRNGRSAQAMDHYRKALALNPRHPATLYEMGMLSSKLGDQVDLERVLVALNEIDREMAAELELATHSLR